MSALVKSELVKSKLGLQQAKSLRAREAICAATIESLAEIGYSETSLNRVAAIAGFSKGALQHHFPNKEDLIAATVDELLARTFRPHSITRQPKDVQRSLLAVWTRFMNTPAYRALLEVLNAARTDKNLQNRLSGELIAWQKKIDEQTLENYDAVSGDPEEAKMLLNMNRSFMRGLLIQERYGVSQEQTTSYVDKWIELISPLLKLKTVESN